MNVRKKPFFSIVTPILDRVDYIDRWFKSISSQKFSNFEVIVCDNGSSDGTYEKLNKISHTFPKLKVVQNLKRGCGSARNSAIENSSGDYVVILDSDNQFASEECLNRLYDHIVKFKSRFIISLSADFSGRIISKNLGQSRYIDISTFLNNLEGEFHNTFEGEWIRNNLYRIYKNCKSEFPMLVNIKVFLESKNMVSFNNLVMQNYEVTSLKDRISSRNIFNKSREMRLYNYLIIKSYFTKILFSSPKFTFISIFKIIIYSILNMINNVYLLKNIIKMSQNKLFKNK